MAEKFVVLYENDTCEGVFDTLSDAEEYILSVAEEAAYEDFLREIMCGHVVYWRPGEEAQYAYDTPEEWFNKWNLKEWGEVWLITGESQPRQTIYSAMLGYFSEYDEILTAPYFN